MSAEDAARTEHRRLSDQHPFVFSVRRPDLDLLEIGLVLLHRALPAEEHLVRALLRDRLSPARSPASRSSESPVTSTKPAFE